MELRALRCLVAVADELHFGRAAERLHLAQPAVSRQIARLERELGVRLFDRSPRQVRLTAAGHRVLEAARQALGAVDRVRIAAASSGSVMRIGMAGGFTARLEHGIDELRKHVSGSDVVLVELPRRARLDALRRGEIDVALVRGVDSAPGLRLLPSWTERLLAVVSVRHRAAGEEVVDLADLAEGTRRIPSPDDDLFPLDPVTAVLREAGVEPHRRRSIATVQSAIVEVGADPHGWTVLSADHVAEITSRRVRAIPFRPRMTVTGSVVIPNYLPQTCASAYRDAFGD